MNVVESSLIENIRNFTRHCLYNIPVSQVESSLVEHSSVAESAAVARPHNVKGECLYCFVTLAEGNTFDDKLIAELKAKGKDLYVDFM